MIETLNIEKSAPIPNLTDGMPDDGMPDLIETFDSFQNPGILNVGRTWRFKFNYKGPSVTIEVESGKGKNDDPPCDGNSAGKEEADCPPEKKGGNGNSNGNGSAPSRATRRPSKRRMSHEEDEGFGNETHEDDGGFVANSDVGNTDYYTTTDYADDDGADSVADSVADWV